MSKFHLRCSCMICRTETSVESLSAHVKKHEKKPTHTCLECGTLFFGSKNSKFCSSSCSGIYTNDKKDWSKIKTGPAKGFIPINNPNPPYSLIGFCVICNKLYKKNYYTVKTCSSKCKGKLISKKLVDSIALGNGGNKNRGRGKQSYMESSFEKWINDHYDIEHITEQPFTRSENGSYKKTYFGDFYFPELKLVIELDGSQHDKPNAKIYDIERDDYIFKEYNTTVIRISHKEYRNGTKKTLIESLLQDFKR